VRQVYRSRVRGTFGAVEQRDAADEGRLEQSRSTMVGQIIVFQGEVVRPSQLIASVGWTPVGCEGETTSCLNGGSRGHLVALPVRPSLLGRSS
jgi:hypothetical protein